MEHPRSAPSGEQYLIRRGPVEARITEVGATLGSLTLDGRDVVDGCGLDERASDGRGQVLAPWPNRIAEGRYEYGGRAVQAPISEPGRNAAIHGLVRWLDWTLVEYDDPEVTLQCAVRPQPGYEWQLLLEVRYTLGPSGLTVTMTSTNTGTERAPFGAGCHPYLRLGDGPVDRLELNVPARQFLTDADAGSPFQSVEGTEQDFMARRAIGASRLDTAYGDLVRDTSGRAAATLRDPTNDESLALWVDESFRYLMVYTGDSVHDAVRRRAAVAVEPMTCPPQAFRTGIDVVELEPGESWSGAWGITLPTVRP